MWLVWGTKKVEKPLGYAAEFCPICRAPRIFKIFRAGMTTHIYFISVGTGELTGYFGRCQECNTAIPIDAAKFVRFEKEAPDKLETLIQATYPDFYRHYEGRLEIENRLRRREPVMLPDREGLLMEPFTILAMDVEDRFAYLRMDREIAIGCAATSVIFTLLACGTASFVKDDFARDSINLGIGLVVFAGMLYTFVQIIRAPKRYVRRMILPRLSRALRPLKPIRHEITDCVARIESKGLRLGKHIVEEELWEAVQKR